MATWFPLSGVVAQRIKSDGKPASGYVLKLYAPGTTTNIPLATDSTGATTATVAVANSLGDWTVSGSTIIPHINQDYKLAIYPTQAAADADSGATLTIDYIVLTTISNVQWIKGDDLASAAALPVISGATYFDVTGTTTITSIDALGVGRVIKLHFDDALTLTHNATTLVLPTGTNITTAAGDEAEFVEYSSGAWRCTNYSRADGSPLAVNVVTDTSPQLGGDLSANGNQIQWSKGADVASATELPVLTDGNYFDVTGTTTVTSIASTAVGNVIKLHFDDALTLTHHATDLILPGGANITTAAGDEAEFIEYATGDYRCTNYQKASGAAVVSSSAGLVLLSTVTASASATADIETTFDSTYDEYLIVATGVVPATDGGILRCLLKVGGSYQTSSYFYVAVSPRSDSATFASVVSQSGTYIQIGEPAGASNETDGGMNLEVRVPEPSQTTRRKHVYWNGTSNAPTGNSSRHSVLSGSGRYNGSASALTGVRFQFSSGNITTGTFRLYGIAKS